MDCMVETMVATDNPLAEYGPKTAYSEPNEPATMGVAMEVPDLTPYPDEVMDELTLSPIPRIDRKYAELENVEAT